MDEAKNLLANVISISMSTILLNPLDCYRARWQVCHHPDMRSHINQILKKEGFYQGLFRPAIFINTSSAIVSRGIGFGLYPTVYHYLSNYSSEKTLIMFFSGLLTGSVGYLFSYPLWRIRLFEQTKYEVRKDLINKTLIKNNSALPTLIIRGALMNVGHTFGYHATKRLAVKHDLFKEGPVLHVTASLVASAFSCLLVMPVDNTLTQRLSHPALNSQTGQTINKMYRGGLTMFLRLSIFYSCYMVVYEQTRRTLGLSYF